MSMAQIRQSYGVPAKRGMRVAYDWGSIIQIGTITGSRDARLLIRMDGDNFSAPFHPTWKLRYLQDEQDRVFQPT